MEKSIKLFLDHIESLHSSLPLVLDAIESTHKKATKVHTEFLEKECEKRTVDGQQTYFVKPELLRRNASLRKEVNHSAISHKIIQRNYTVSLVSQFDSFLGSLIRTMFYMNPELLNQSEKQLTFSNLIDFGDIESAREYIIEKEIESVLRESHTTHFKWLESKLKTKLREDLEIWPIFIELTERRNLFVHNNGTVSSQYLKICKENSVKLDPELEIGKELKVGPRYFEKAFKCVFELGIKLSQVMWRKLKPKDVKDADLSILRISYELIQNKQYDLAQVLLDFCDKYIKKFSSDDIRFRLILNRAQTYKWMGNQDMCLKIVNSKDWSACSDIFKLTSQVLIDEHDLAIKTMKLVGKDSKDLDKTAYREWPIFKEIKKKKEFVDCFKSIFNESYETKEAYSPDGYKLIDEDTFLERLDDCLEIAKGKPNGFVSAKFFVETHLAKNQYDIGKSWELFEKLEEKGRIVTYTHSDEKGSFPPLRAVRKKE